MILSILIFICSHTQLGNTPLHLAAKKGHLVVVQYLLNCKAEVNIKNEVCCSYQVHLNWLSLMQDSLNNNLSKLCIGW